ncbi:hypothetical protein C0Q70_09235 [Pomacea canaliculata]|uniref:Uncharacterized protein n=1 Tax=Pomacea canaliculata TaxID=400727 RepID=A0A2T7P977_POMCA|nr:hypothetical protein C0Q70_09235 [Pomacea canaliculata]
MTSLGVNVLETLSITKTGARDYLEDIRVLKQHLLAAVNSLAECCLIASDGGRERERERAITKAEAGMLMVNMPPSYTRLGLLYRALSVQENLRFTDVYKLLFLELLVFSPIPHPRQNLPHTI